MDANVNIPGYQVLALAGSGRSSRVWQGRDRLGNEVALRPVPQAQIEQFRIRFEALKHHAGSGWAAPLRLTRDDDGTAVLVSEFVPGPTAAQIRTASGGLALTECWWLLAQLLKAAAGLHQLGVVHGDISPANIVAVPDDEGRADRAVLVDVLQPASAEAGTAGFVAPEVRRGGPASTRSDTYSIACVVEHMAAPVVRTELADMLAPLKAEDPGKRASSDQALRFLPAEPAEPPILPSPQALAAAVLRERAGRAETTLRKQRRSISRPTVRAQRGEERLGREEPPSQVGAGIHTTDGRSGRSSPWLRRRAGQRGRSDKRGRPAIWLPRVLQRFRNGGGARHRRRSGPARRAAVIAISVVAVATIAVAGSRAMSETAPPATAVQGGQPVQFEPAEAGLESAVAVSTIRLGLGQALSRAVAEDLFRMRDAALNAGDERAFTALSEPGTEIARREKALWSSLDAAGATIENYHTRIGSVGVREAGPTTIEAKVVFVEEPYVRVERGERIQVPRGDQLCQLMTLHKSGRWRVENVQPCAEQRTKKQ